MRGPRPWRPPHSPWPAPRSETGLDSTALHRRQAALDATSHGFNFVREQVIRDPEIADLYLRGLRDFASLELRDRLRFGMLLQNFFFTFQATFV